MNRNNLFDMKLMALEEQATGRLLTAEVFDELECTPIFVRR